MGYICLLISNANNMYTKNSSNTLAYLQLKYFISKINMDADDERKSRLTYDEDYE